MKLVQNAKKFETNNNEVQSQDFSIGDASVVIEILRNKMYKHKIRTLVQEYICNGRDATREINANKPIEVTCPTSLEPMFKVRDYGPGISPDRMSKVFVQYGSSTKRDSNGQTGGFGIGAKSAWSYTDSFNIITYIDGTKRTYIAHTGVNNNGRLDHISTENTSEENGTEIQIAVSPKDNSEFKRSIFRAIYFWSESVKLIGIPQNEIPKMNILKTFSKSLTIHNAEKLTVIGRDVYSTDNVVTIDSIPYPLTSDLTEKIPNYGKLITMINRSCVIVFTVPNGYLEVGASREEISNSEYTQKNLKRLIDENYVKLYNELKSQFDKTKTTQEYLTLYMELSKEFNVDCFSKISTDYEVKNGRLTGEILNKVSIERCSLVLTGPSGFQTLKVHKSQYASSSRSRYKYYSSGNSVSPEEFNHIFFYDKNDTMIKSNLRIKEYLETNKYCLIVTPETVNGLDNFGVRTEKVLQKEFNQVVQDLNVRCLSSINYVEPPKIKKTKVPLQQKEFNIHCFGSYKKVVKRITLQGNSQKWIYFEMNDKMKFAELFNHRGLDRYLVNTKADYRICALSAENALKVKNDKNFITLDTWLSKFKPSNEDIKQFLRPLINGFSNAKKLSRMSKIKDKFLNEAIDVYNDIQIKTGIQYDIPDCLHKVIKNTDLYKNSLDIDDKFCKLIKDKYILISWMSEMENKIANEEFLTYINLKYESEK